MLIQRPKSLKGQCLLLPNDIFWCIYMMLYIFIMYLMSDV